MELKVFLSTLKLKGYLAYEYNPFYNFQTSRDIYLINNKYLVPEGLAVNKKNGELLTPKNNPLTAGEIIWIDKRGAIIPDENVITTTKLEDEEYRELYIKAGSVMDLDTEKLNFDLEHPVEIEVLPSYDGSVNLILNDDKNPPRIINSRFSTREKNTYEIVDRIGLNNSNIYNSDTFDKDTSLYFLYESNPKIEFINYIKGNLQVGLYCFYFTYCDSDENESDYIAETGLIPAFIGSDKDPKSMDGGIKNQTSNKGIRLRVYNLNKSYDYIKVYYVRYFADYALNRVYECKKILRKYPINLSSLYLHITGYEDCEDLDPNILNITRFNPKSILTLAQCKNMLFFGNIVKNSDNYTELTDCALRIIPELSIEKLSDVDLNYESDTSFGYYNSNNIYNKTGYFNKEYYRFGIVFIYNNGTLSNVYNTVGGVLKRLSDLVLSTKTLFSSDGIYLNRKYIKYNEDGFINNDSDNSFSGDFVNAKGVCRIDVDNLEENEIIGINFKFDNEVIDFLKSDLGIRGFFIVRQKCLPNIIALCYLLPIDEVLEAPVIAIHLDNNKYQCQCESFLDKDGLLTNIYLNRLKYSDVNETPRAFAAICPDFLLNLPYYNQIFNGSKFRLESLYEEQLNRDNLIDRIYKAEIKNLSNSLLSSNVVLSTVTEDVLTVALNLQVYRLEVGKTEESYRFEFFGLKNEEDLDATNLIRGKYSPYLAVYDASGTLRPNYLYNIYRNVETDIPIEFLNRMDSSEPFYAISDRYNFDEIPEAGKQLTCWRGDCYLNTFTYRLNRNFNDPSLPNNDKIIDKNTWKDNYLIDLPEKWADISTSDVNAVQLGSWITFKVRSAMNYALRSVDHSYVAEEALMGAPRSFYPRSLLLWRGENKLPDSYLYNDAYRASLGYKCYFALPDVNYIKDTFSNRILYSAIAILDSFKNNYRYSLSTYFRDYSQEYGSIQKLVGFEGYLLVVFEHAIGIAVVNERVLAGGGDGEPVFINTLNVLPEELTIITDTYGTQWGDSVVKSEAGYVYGIDTVAKKIWRVKGQQIEILSDFKVNKFLVDNITFSERETTPTIGLRNIKTHYNNNKKDIIFTFYDDKYKDEENAWSLCYNELLGAFVTFYSWIPSFSENIDTKFFTFNRNTSKALALLLKCNYAIPENKGVLLDSPVIEDNNVNISLYYSILLDTISYTIVNEDGTTSIRTITGEEGFMDNVKFRIEPDHWGNYKKFIINNNNELKLLNGVEFNSLFTKEYPIIFLYITPYIEDMEDPNTETFISTSFKTEVVAFTSKEIVENASLTSLDKSKPNLTTDFYLHGRAGIFNVAENLYPTYWYGEYHPFEFEFVVNDKIGLQKVFTDLIMISNKAEPESFHFEIEGDNYEFSSDKRNMYFRQEATKNLYLNLGSDMIYNRYYTDVAADKYTYELYYRGNPTRRDGRNNVSFEEYTQLYANLDRVYPIDSLGLTLQVKSTIFPLYYEKVDTFNNIYHDYIMMHDDDGVYDFLNLSGSEISWNRDLNQFNIITHIKNRPIDLVGRLRGNSRYKEGKWHIQIPTISFMLKNEDDWPTLEEMPQALKDEGPLANRDSSIKVPSIVINSQNIPNNVDFESISNIISNNTGCEGGYVEGSSWSNRKETRIRDKWMKVRVRYSGKNLAIIHSLTTLYNLSYS